MCRFFVTYESMRNLPALEIKGRTAAVDLRIQIEFCDLLSSYFAVALVAAGHLSASSVVAGTLGFVPGGTSGSVVGGGGVVIVGGA